MIGESCQCTPYPTLCPPSKPSPTTFPQPHPGLDVSVQLSQPTCRERASRYGCLKDVITNPYLGTF